MVLAVSAGCGAAAPRPSPDTLPSGVSGRTIVDGGCPVISEATPCPDKPLSALLTIVNGEGAVVAETVSNSQGEFLLPVPPGNYELRPSAEGGGPLPYAPPRPVSVDPGRYKEITVRFDSGIR